MINTPSKLIATLALLMSSAIVYAEEPMTTDLTTPPAGRYLREFQAFANSPEYQAVFNDDGNASLGSIRCDITNYSQLNLKQRVVRNQLLLWPMRNLLFGALILVEAKNMPTLHDYIQKLCQEHQIVTPTIFITQNKNILNAFAFKLLGGSETIVLTPKIITETTDSELEGILAHELGHIKHDHVRKMFYISLATYAAAYGGSLYFQQRYQALNKHAIRTADNIGTIAAMIGVPLIINKRFEKQADEFACQAQHSTGLIEFFNRLEHKAATEDQAFSDIRQTLKTHSSQINWLNKGELYARYFITLTGHKLKRAYRWFYHHTPYGAHPSPAARIRAAQAYLQRQAAANNATQPETTAA